MDEKRQESKMIPSILELKALLTDVLSSDKTKLRKKGMEDAMEIMEELEMDSKPLENALKLNNIDKENKIIENILVEVDELEYASDEKLENLDKTHIDSSEE